ncbi:MAG: MopE-related protein [archaeon]
MNNSNLVKNISFAIIAVILLTISVMSATAVSCVNDDTGPSIMHGYGFISDGENYTFNFDIEDDCNPIQAAEMFIKYSLNNTVFTCDTPGTGMAMDAEDGVFDEIRENTVREVSYFYDQSGWYAHCFQAQDSEDNWGTCICSPNEYDGFPPTIENININPAFNNGYFSFTADAVDDYSGIRAAEYFISHDSNFQCPERTYNSGIGTPLNVSDGNWWNQTEEVYANDVEYLVDGSNLLCIRAQDDFGHHGVGKWGECTCATFETDSKPPIVILSLVNGGHPEEELVCDDDPTVFATICDSESPIPEAEYFLDLWLPPSQEIPLPGTGYQMTLVNEYMQLGTGWYCSDFTADIPLEDLEDGTHYLNQIRGMDAFGNWGKIYFQNFNYSFIKDTTPPSTDKDIVFGGDRNVPCQISEAMGETITNGCYYVQEGTEIFLTAEDPDPQGTNEFAGDVLINYIIWWSEDGQIGWEILEEGQSNVDEPVSFTLDEPSYHLIEYWAEDGCDEEETHHFELDIVHLTWCGDGEVQSPNTYGEYEECDGLAGVGSHQECTQECTLVNLTYCGDDIKQSPNDEGTFGPNNDGYEECDGTDGVGLHQECLETCELINLTWCGDNETQYPNDYGEFELCDENGDNTDTACDPGYNGECSWCDLTCQPHNETGPFCGDDIKNGPEECDGTDGVGLHQECSEVCTLVDLTFCGDETKQTPNDELLGGPLDDGYEDCDFLDGVGAHQVCEENCTLTDLTWCGDGIKQNPNDEGIGGPFNDGNEECDGTDGVGDHEECSETCEIIPLTYCGDDIKQQPNDEGTGGPFDDGMEECDGLAGVGPHQECDDNCELVNLTYCGDGIIQDPNDDGQSEECDGTAGVGPHQECSEVCTLEDMTYCGDDIKQTPNDELLGGPLDDGYEECDGTDGVGAHQQCEDDCSLTDLTFCGDEVKQYPNDELLGGPLNDGYEDCDFLDGVGPHQECEDNCTLTDLTYCGDDIKQTPNDELLGGPLDDGYEECDGTDGVGLHESCTAECTITDLTYCGDGIKQSPNDYNEFEECDGTDGVGPHQECNEFCELEDLTYCGDDIKQTPNDELLGGPLDDGYEECDGTDGVGTHQQCEQDCTLTDLPWCGDGEVNQGWELCDENGDNTDTACDPGYNGECSWCDLTCQPHELFGPYCGDGVKDSPYEECDGTDGVGLHESCTAECTITDLTYCGDGIKQSPNDYNEFEECDGTDGVGPHQECSQECTLEDLNWCGDGIVQNPNDYAETELCDENGANTNTACSPDYDSSCDWCDLECQPHELFGPYCGDGVKDSPYEECDGTDGVGLHQECTQECTLEDLPWCGDGIVNQPSELCDENGANTDTPCTPGYESSCDYCDTSCQPHEVEGPYCGDGIVNHASEQCDDGNLDEFDGCMSNCRTTNFECQGIDIVADGVGMNTQPQTLTQTVSGEPILGLLYWSYRGNGDDTITVDGTSRTGLLTGTPLVTSIWWAETYTYVNDFTDEVSQGSNSWTMSGMNSASEQTPEAAALLTVYEDEEVLNIVQIKSHNDFYYVGLPDTLNADDSDVVTFEFEAGDKDRNTKVILVVGDAAEFDWDGTPRTDKIWYKTGTGVPPTNVIGENLLAENQLKSADGKEADTYEGQIVIPEGHTYLAIQIESPEPPVEGDSGILMATAIAIDCMPDPFCGDGKINGDPIVPPVPEPVCGNGIKEKGELCDDGNLINGDGCSSQCRDEQQPILPGDECAQAAGYNDGGRNHGVKGSICVSNCDNPDWRVDFMTDYCVSSKVLYETNCEDGKIVNYELNCGPGICQAGRCVSTTPPPPPPEPVPTEECDDGELNGVECNPEYDSFCTFCTDECKLENITGGFCGDGIWQPIDEECEGTNGVPEGYLCTTECTLTDDPCYGPEICDGIDNTCDGLIDENDVCGVCTPGETQEQFCRTDVGECQSGTKTRDCINNGFDGGIWDSWSVCTGFVGPTTETCDGLDNNCDGFTDEGFDVGDSCSVGVGQCMNTGNKVCTQDGLGTECNAVPFEPNQEMCDGLDNDCNTVIDNGFDVGASCTSDENFCGDTSQGTKVCSTFFSTTCDATVPEERPEWNKVCYSEANSCGDTDIGLTDCDGVCNAIQPGERPGYGDSCNVGIGECYAEGYNICASEGVMCDAVEGTPSTEWCNGLDDNCNGEIDEGDVCGDECNLGDTQTRACGSDIGICEFGRETQECEDNGLGGTEWGEWGSCEGGISPTTEICDGLDNNCNDAIDEDLTRPTTCGVGICEGNTGEETCTLGNWGDDTCDPFEGSQTEYCNGVDDSCNGFIDEDNVCGVCEEGETNIQSCGLEVGLCQPGTKSQVCQDNGFGGGLWGPWGECIGYIGPVDEICDGFDNDCDLLVDEGMVCVVCGDGDIDYPYEECDDGNTENGDGCSATCRIEAVPQCSDGIDNDGDGKIDYPDDSGCDSYNDDREYSVNEFNAELKIVKIDAFGYDYFAGYAGGDMLVGVTIENIGEKDANDVEVGVILPELGFKTDIAEIDIDNGEKRTMWFYLRIPKSADPGVYYLGIYAGNDDVRRTKYVEIRII